MTKIISWNINGLGTIKEKGFVDLVKKEQPDIICLQETRKKEDNVEKLLKPLSSEYNLDCFSSHREDISGYSGVATLSRLKPTKISKTFGSVQFEKEGRILISEYPSFVLYNCYFPTGASDPKYQKMKREFYKECTESVSKTMISGKEIILCGDFNTARDERDVANAAQKKTTPGFLDEDRDDIKELFSLGLIDAFRIQNKDGGNYTWWYNAECKKNESGWRIDYFLISPGLEKKFQACTHKPDLVKDDHCPIILELKEYESGSGTIPPNVKSIGSGKHRFCAEIELN